MHADLLEAEEPIHEPHVPVGGAAGANVTEHRAVLARQVFRADRGDRARAHVRDVAGVDHGDGRAGLGIEQIQQRHL